VSIGVGSVLCGRYGLEASIGRGGMGEVFSASNLETGDRVAIKVVTRSALGDLLVQRLYREAQAAARVQSAYVPRLIEVARDEQGELFLVMELLHGETLSEHLRRVGGFLTWDDVRWIGEHVLLGLIDAHAAGVVHRDLKPGNIFLETASDGGFAPRPSRAKVLDFGVCKLDSQDVEHLTTTGEALGTIAYMAPEQIRGASKVDERADLYSFAMVIFEALSGRLAHDASGQMAMIASKLERSARALRDLAQVPVPAGLDALVGRALARNPNERFSSAQELLRAWRALGPATVMPRVLAIHSGGANIMQTQTVMTAGLAASNDGARSSKLGLLLAGTALLGATALLVFVLVGRPHASRAAELPPPTPVAAAAVPAPAPSPSATDPAPSAPQAPAPAPAAASAGDPAADPPSPADDPQASTPPSPPTPATRPTRATRPPRQAPPPQKKVTTGPHIQDKPRY
jgi:eukaryotic-like serine/threonine-protein kinase